MPPRTHARVDDQETVTGEVEGEGGEPIEVVGRQAAENREPITGELQRGESSDRLLAVEPFPVAYVSMLMVAPHHMHVALVAECAHEGDCLGACRSSVHEVTDED